LATVAQVEITRNQRRATGLEPEFQLLLACCRMDFDESDAAALFAAPLDWDRILKLAERHRLVAPLHAFIREREDVPGSIRSAIRARFEGHALRGLRFSAELARIATQFTDLQIHVLAHKGPALAQFLYGDSAMRQFGDLDFLVRVQDVTRAKALLGELGYKPRIRLSPRQERAYLQSGYEYVFGTNAEPNLVELQWQILPRFYSIGFEMESLFNRSVETEVQGFRLRTLGKEDLMLVMCVHAAKHEWAQLGMLRDIAALARVDLDWEWIAGEARRLGILRILGISLLLASNLVGAKVTELMIERKCEELAAAIQSSLVRGVNLETESLRYFRFVAQVREQWRDRLRLIWRLSSTPSVGEWQAVGVPDPLFPLYRGVRAVRLLRRVCSRS